MNHAYYLAKMPHALRAQIEAETIYYSWLKQGETLESIWSHPGWMETVYRQLSDRERSVLHLIVKAIGCEPFDSGRIERLAAASMPGAEAKVGFLQLLRKGLVYPFRKSWGEHVYIMSHDGFAMWQRLLLQATDEMIVSEEQAASIRLTDSHSPGLAHDVFRSLVYIAHNELKLTKNGTLHKKHLQKLNELLSFPSYGVEGTGMKYAYADVYSPQIAVLLEFLMRLELIGTASEVLLLNHSKTEQWLSRSEEEQIQTLYVLWKQAAFPAPVWLQHAAVLLERQAQGQWIYAEGLVNQLRDQGIPVGGISGDGLTGGAGSEQDAVTQLEQQWILPLIAFGWMEKGRDGQGHIIYRWVKHPLSSPLLSVGEHLPDRTHEQAEEANRFYVQPDFELLVPPGVSFLIHWELSVIADLKQFDQLSIYKLSKESLQRALENGRSAEEMIRFLERFGMYGLPDNVKLTVEQWARPFGKVSLAQVLLLRCEDDTIAAAIGKLPGSEAWLAEQVGSTAWIVRPDQVKRASEALSKAGWMPGKVAPWSESADMRTDASPGDGRGLLKPDWARLDMGTASFPDIMTMPAGQGFIYSRHGIGYFDMEQRLPDIRELYPDLNGIPSGWTKDYRSYHISTRREMVEKAMEWRAGLQLRYNGQDHYIAPRKLQETRGTWSMTGLMPSEQQEVCWFPEEWQEMKIILPGINDKY